MLIYKATFPNKKSYIGLTTSCDLEKRKKKHLVESFNKNQKSYNVIFHKAIRKYGWKNVKWNIIEDNIPSDFILKEKEKFYIKLFNTIIPFGYNMTSGGDGGDTYKNNPNYNNIIEKLKIRSGGKNNPMYGRIGKLNPKFGTSPTKKQRENMSRGRSKYTCILKNIRTGKIYNTDNVHKFARDMFNVKDHHFYDLIRGERKSYRDFIILSFKNRKEKKI